LFSKYQIKERTFQTPFKRNGAKYYNPPNI